MTTLPNGWVETTLAEVTLPYETIDPNRFPDTQFSYIDIGSIDNRTQTIRETKAFMGQDAPSRARRIVKKGDVLFSTVRTYLKNIAVVPEGLEGQLTSTGIAILRPNEAVDGRYLFNWVCSDDFISTMSKEQDGTLYPAVTDKDVARGTIPLPPLPEQRRIVAKVDGITARTARARAALERIPTLIARYKLRLLELLYSDFGSATQINHRPFSDVISSAQNGISKRRGDTGRMVNVLRLGDLMDGHFVGHDPRGIMLTADEQKKYGLEDDDLLCIRVNGSENLVGRMLVWVKNSDWAFCDHFIRFKINPKICTAKYLSYFFATDHVRAQIESTFVSSAGQKTVNQGTLGRILVPVPPIEQQVKIVHRIETAFAWLDRMAAEHRVASTLLPKLDAAILAKAFRGELVPQDPNDEPPSVLLERIKSEGQIAGTPKRTSKHLKADNAKLPSTFGEIAPRVTLDRVYIARDQFQLSLIEKSAMSKSRQDEDVMGKPYLASLIKRGLGNTVQDLFKASDLPVADFYKQLAWEIDQKHIRDDDQKLEAV